MVLLSGAERAYLKKDRGSKQCKQTSGKKFAASPVLEGREPTPNENGGVYAVILRSIRIFSLLLNEYYGLNRELITADDPSMKNFKAAKFFCRRYSDNV